MLLEYAVEPHAIGRSWEHFRYLIEKFGFDRGRLISRFPRDWERSVIEAAKQSGMADVRFKKLVEKLARAKHDALIPSGRSYDSEMSSWVENAVSQHELNPFQAIIASERHDANDAVLVADDLEDGHQRFESPVNWEVPRVGTQLAKAMAPLLQTAKHVLLVDKYMKFEDARYRETLKEAFAAIAAGRQGCGVCEIHVAEHARSPSIQHLHHNAKKYLPQIIPNGMTVRLFQWKEKHGGEDFHARYLLTDRGGLIVDAGFSADGANQKVMMSLLDIAVARAKVEQFKPEANVYDLVEPALEIS
jgi:hypothetical protein